MPSFARRVGAATVSLVAFALVGVGASSASAATPLAACTSYGSVYTSDLSTWNTSDTRATGHQAIQPDGGLHIFTEGATSTDKVAGYYPTIFPLTAIGTETISQSMDFTGIAGATVPGLQLVVDFDGDGNPDGTLVGEPTYGNTWWLNTASSAGAQALAPHTGGGYGSNYWGTLDEWSAAAPVAHVLAIGYSLGSGVHNDGVLSRITLGCVNYTWGPVVAAAANASATAAGDGTEPAVADPTPAAPALAATGASSVLPLGIASGLLLVGGLMLWGRRRLS